MTKPDSIPVIDIAAIHSADDGERQALCEEFFRVYSTVGFSYVVNHGVPDSLIEGVFDASRRFHALSLDRKMEVELNQLHRGFIPINTSTDVNSTLADVKHPNQSESFMVMREDLPDTPQVLAGDFLAGANQWPELAGFRQAVMGYNDAMAALAQQLMGLAFQSLGAAPDIMAAFDPPTTWLRLLYYPTSAGAPVSLDDLASSGVYGSAPHTDFGCLTLLAQDEIGGLQVQSPGGDWIDVPRIPGSFVVNVGDMLHRWSNGQLRSTPHRVINASGKPRYSCPFFYDPGVATDISPLDSCVSQAQPARFESINFGEFLNSELTAGYDHHKATD